MARLIGVLEESLSTDFALLAVGQSGAAGDGPSTTTYAASGPGAIVMVCGTKYAELEVRVERWDAEPQVPGHGWEDCDELPFEPVSDGGPLQVWAFDPPGDEAGLSVEGLGRARVQVLAAGRHRYGYSDSAEGLPPERWLVRIWPDGEHRDAMSGSPRRIAGPLPHTNRRTAWIEAHHGWRRTGWSSYLLGIQACQIIERALVIAGGPCDPDDLVTNFGPWGVQRERAGAYTWDSPVLGHGWAIPAEVVRPDALVKLRAMAAATGMPSIDTFRDALEFLERLGLIGRQHGVNGGHLVLNPAPRPVWEVLELSPASERGLRTQGLWSDYQYLENDLEHLLRWAPNQRLVTTPERIAVRLSVGVDDILGGLQLLDILDRVSVHPKADARTRMGTVTIWNKRADVAHRV